MDNKIVKRIIRILPHLTIVLSVMFITFWILDILNMPFMEFLDTTIPINGLAWFLIFMAMPLANDSKK